MIDSDAESENETHGAGEDFTGVSGVTIECNNPQSVSEMIELILTGQKKNYQPQVLVSAKIPWSVMS